MTPSPLETKLQEWIKLCEWSDCGPHSKELGVFLESIRTALQDERGRAREAALHDALATIKRDSRMDNNPIGPLYGAGWASASDHHLELVQGLKSQSPPGEAQGWRTPGTVEVCQLCCEEPFLKPNCKGHDSELGHLKCPVRKPLPAPPLPTETEG